MSDIKTSQWLAEQQAIAGLSDQELASAMGYASAQVVQMFKTGDMSIPLVKVPALATVLSTDPGALMRRLLQDADSALLQVIEHCMGAIALSSGEQKLIAALRKMSPGKDPVPITFDRDAIITLVVA